MARCDGCDKRRAVCECDIHTPGCFRGWVLVALGQWKPCVWCHDRLKFSTWQRFLLDWE
jgi:hypothetical protein